MFAHISGIPVEETALSLVPIAAATGGIAGMRLREQVERRRARKRRGISASRKHR
jgi:hypothetical protein